MQGVFGLSIRLVAGAVALVAGLWVLHPGFDRACQQKTPGLCFSGIWREGPTRIAQSTAPKDTSPTSALQAIRRVRTARKNGNLPQALSDLDLAGQWALRQYEAEERQGANRRVRYLFVDLDLEARLLAAAAVKAKAPDISGPAMRYSETFAALASVEGVDLVLRRANLRAPKSLDGAILSQPLARSIREFWQDLAPTEVFFSTDRAATDEDTGYFGPAISGDGDLVWGAASINVPVYVNEAAGADQQRQVEDAPERGERQTVSVRTVKRLSLSQFDARSAGELTSAAHKDVMIYLHGAEIGFEPALIRAAELKRALRIDGPVAVISWGVDAQSKTSCASAATAKLVLTAWKRMAKIADGARLHVVAHGQGVCAGFAPYDHGGDEAEIEMPAANLILLQPDYGHDDVKGPFHRAPSGAETILIYYNQDATRLAKGPADQVCPWDAAEDDRKAFSRPEKQLTVHKIEVGLRPAAANRLDGPDYLLDSILEDLRAQMWTGAVQPGGRCGMCKVMPDKPVVWRLFADRCGEQQTLALDLRRELGARADGALDQVLKDLSPAEREMVRDRLKTLPPRR